jgi:hypothetical protein
MMRRGLALPVSTMLALGLVGCSDDGGRDEGTDTPAMTMTTPSLSMPMPTEDDATTAETPTTTVVGTDGSGDATTVDPTTGGMTGELVIDPAMSVVILENGVAPPQQLKAYLNGQEVDANWSNEATFLGFVDENGLVNISATNGGSILVDAEYNGLTASAVVDVLFKKEVVLGDFPDTDKMLLDGAVNPDPAALLAYPYDTMVYPKGLPAPELMWNGTLPGDKYLVHLTGDLLDIKIYTTAEPPSRFLPDQPTWDGMAETISGGKVKMKLHRLSAGVPTVVADDDWTITSQPLIGSVYYWANSLGRVLRINPGALAPEDFLSTAGYNDCSTCHSVSANGKVLILGGDVNISNFNLPDNVKTNSLPEVNGKPIRQWAMAGISADGSVVIENGELGLPGPPGGAAGLWDSVTGAAIPSALDGIPALNMPMFSPNNKKIVYVGNAASAFPQHLAAYDYDQATKSVSNPITLVPPGADPALNGITFPYPMPDGKWAVYHRGSYPASLDTRGGPGHLYLASTEIPNTEIRLANAEGDTYPFVAGARDLHWNYEPTFAPRTSGGYAWVVFTSRRTYGNKLTGDQTVVKQLWMMAIDENPQPGVDPSHPAFWMPGQDPMTLNMRGFWALEKDDPGG